MKRLIVLSVISLLVGCATTPSPEKMRDKWVGADNSLFNKDYTDCRMKADEQAPGAGTMVTTVLLWPVGLAMGVSYAIQSENTMKLCMSGKGWSPK